MKISIDGTEGVAIYLQIMEGIKRAVVREELKLGKRVTPVRELATRLGVNPNTVARAYMELEREGILVSKRGMGTFVTEDKEKIENERRGLAKRYVRRFKKEMEELGFSLDEVFGLIEE
ncbi:MAG: GntR family transcriptional regulator [Candidatus Latescibacteria bacterium]|nr:GntR family transcriptional regulator [Candidatus Latescibacterota bacterium]